MTLSQVTLAALLGALLCLSARADLPVFSQNPYHHIVELNVFRLTPLPPPPAPPPAPLPEVTLTGITTILADKRALLTIHFPAGKAGPARQEQCILKEGQRVGEVEVLDINEKAGCVTLNNSGMIMTATFAPHNPEQKSAATGRPAPHPQFRLAVH